MLNDGTYREARALRFNDSLMPLYRRWQTRDGYESVSTGKGTSRLTHNLVYEALNGPVPVGYVVHHRNHVHFDNAPENLELLDAGSHSSHHRLARPSFDNGSPAFQDRRLAGIREHGYNHKVISVESIDERADVYCLQVEKYHNFALAAGVFVHNCGMIAVRTQFTAADAESRGDLAALRTAIERAIPLSAGKYNGSVYSAETAGRVEILEQRDGADSAEKIAPNWRLQLGSLGSGNHFIEVSLDEEDRVWLFLHSGSRGVGNKLAQRHIKIAQALAKKWWIALPDPDLAYLVEGTGEFWAYIRDLRWAQHFALLNREEMMHRVVDCVQEWIGRDVEASETVNTHHNYTARETHFGKEVWLSRKGAIDATAGRPGLIPGSMGTRSYVVTGLGNRLALNSAPHGAGRRYSRSAARKTFTREQLDSAMAGIEWRRTDAFLDEIPGAYKPVDVVMDDAKDLVEITHTLRQIVNVKGD
jgi:tRNA-splicing ligase RtcB